MVAAQSSAISESRGTFTWFQSGCVYSLLNVALNFVTANDILELFVAFESCNWFVLKIFFSNSLADSMFQFVWIILLMFGKNRLNIIANWMRVFIVVPFLLPFMSLSLSSFSTVLMYQANSSELYPCSGNQFLSFEQWRSKSFDAAQIRWICSAWLYGTLYLNDFGCSGSIWSNLGRLFCFV